MQHKLRTGPYPLSVHLGMAASSWPVFSAAQDIDLLQEMTQGLEQMLQGIKLYQAHDFQSDQDDLPLVWEQGSVQLRHAAGTAKGPALLLAPSLINRSGILDLCAQRSLTRWLASQGMQVYILDWGDITQDPDQDSMDTLITEHLIPAIDHVYEAEGAPMAALGYCMGGTMLMSAAAQEPEKIDRLIMLAAPWDFHAGSGDLLNRVKYWAPSVEPYINRGQPVPVEGIQTLFASLDPAMAARKFIKFASLDLDSDEAKLFVAVEDWLNDGVALPAAIAQECIDDWFFANTPGQGNWRDVDPSMLQQKTLIITSKKDRLVEYDCAAALQQLMPHAEILDPDCGHIGMIAGRASIEKMWAPLASWILQSK